MTVSENRYDRSEPGTGIVSWIYEYKNREPPAAAVHLTTGFEIGVQLRGDWTLDRLGRGARVFGPGETYFLSAAERYTQSFRARDESGLQVGFIVYPDELPRFADGRFRFIEGAPPDRSFVEFCRAFQHDADRGNPLRSRDVTREVLGFFARNLEPVPNDPLLEAKRAIDRHFDRPLYLAQLAEAAAMQPTTFARAFARRFGVTPIRYRLHLRLNEAARLSWARPELSIAEVAFRAGFEDLPYFHRAFLRQFGLTPAAYGRRSRG
jgi:AraC-like DNA-binding protein